MGKAAVIDPPPNVAAYPRWVGACHDTNDERFFPEEWELKPHPDIAILCAKCPFQPRCLQAALDCPDTDGIWGGTTPHQRKQLLNERNRMRCPGCKSDAVIPQNRGEICISCGLSWLV